MKMCLTFVLCFFVLHVTADRMYYPYEYRSVPSDMDSNLPFPNSNIQKVRPPQIIHMAQPKQDTDADKDIVHSNSLNEILHKIDQLSKSDEKPQNHRIPSEVATNRASIGPKTSFEPWIPSFQEKSIFLPPVKIENEAFNKLTPKLDLLEPVAAKMSSKVNGLVDLVLALVGNSNNLLMRGFKHILIDGIIKPMLLVKGGLRVLVSKLAIPVISLVLINVEILITVWWMWDDCLIPPKQIIEPIQLRNAINETDIYENQ